MKRMIALIFCAAAVFSVFPEEMPGPVSLGLVSQDIDGILMRQYQIGGICSLDINRWFTLSVPVMYTYDQQSSAWMVESSAHGSVYPGGGNIWIGTTILHHIMLHTPDLEHLWMQELSLGYVFTIASRWRITPYIVFRDPFRRYQEELTQLQEHFPSYGTVEPGIAVRWYPGSS